MYIKYYIFIYRKEPGSHLKYMLFNNKDVQIIRQEENVFVLY